MNEDLNALQFTSTMNHTVSDIMSAGLAVSSAKRKLPEETAEEMEGKKHFLPWKKRRNEIKS